MFLDVNLKEIISLSELNSCFVGGGESSFEQEQTEINITQNKPSSFLFMVIRFRGLFAQYIKNFLTTLQNRVFNSLTRASRSCQI